MRPILLGKGCGIFFLRIFIGIRLIYGSIDNILNWDRMLEFRDFLISLNFPIPIWCATISVYAQFICGLLFIIGYQIKWAALVMIFNFIIASMIHWKTGFESMTPALAIFFSCLLFFIEGPGKLAFDNNKDKNPLQFI